MSELQEIEVIIEPNGNVRIRVMGVKGPACLALTKKMEELLGGQVLDRQNTDEMNETADGNWNSDRQKISI